MLIKQVNFGGVIYLCSIEWSNRKIKQNNLIFSFLLNSNWKEIVRPWEKAKKEKLKSKQKEKMNQKNESNIRAFNLN